MHTPVFTINEHTFAIPIEGFSLVEILYHDQKSTYEVGGVTEAPVDHTGTQITYYDEGNQVLSSIILKNPPPPEQSIPFTETVMPNIEKIFETPPT
jgi:hypothetical protein